jgi:hypothetical protein
VYTHPLDRNVLDGREHEIKDVRRHDKQSRQWCANLEFLEHGAKVDLEARVRQIRAMRRALSARD